MLYEIIFYRDEDGEQPVLTFIKKLQTKKDKDSLMQLKKICEYIEILKIYGTRAGEPYVKHIQDKIWELRPSKNRILFVGEKNGKLILLHQFVKKTQKTPKREIEIAIKILEKINK